MGKWASLTQLYQHANRGPCGEIARVAMRRRHRLLRCGGEKELECSRLFNMQLTFRAQSETAQKPRGRMDLTTVEALQ
jgi:hypothetical protein